MTSRRLYLILSSLRLVLLAVFLGLYLYTHVVTYLAVALTFVVGLALSGFLKSKRGRAQRIAATLQRGLSGDKSRLGR